MHTNIQSKKERIHHWDFSRAFYLLLGIPFHATLAYQVTGEWVINSPDKSYFLTIIADAIHTFRMPGFFLLAGFFSIMILMRTTPLGWLKSRMMRLAVPLASATLIILPVQMLFEAAALSYNETASWDATAANFATLLTKFGEPWVSHLWFLWSLIAYTIFLAVIRIVIGGERLGNWLNKSVDWVLRHRISALIVFLLSCVAAAVIERAILNLSPYYGETLIGYNSYFIYFCAGIFVFFSGRLQSSLVSCDLNKFSLGMVLAAFSLFTPANLLMHAVQVATGVLGAILIIASVTSWAARHFSKPNAQVKKLVDASFTIYLFHHPIILGLAAFFLTLDWHPIIEFNFIMFGAALLSYAIHKVIVKSRTLKLMFNGVSSPLRDTKPNTVRNSQTIG